MPSGRPLLALLAVLALPVAPASAADCAGADALPTAHNTERIRSATRCLLNEERGDRSLRALAADDRLTSAAQRYSRLMVRESFFGHVSPGGSTMLSRIRSGTGYLSRASSYALGENIAWGSGRLATPRQTVTAWMRSSGHRANILDRRFRQIGIGVAFGAPRDVGGAPAATYTTDFGSRS